MPDDNKAQAEYWSSTRGLKWIDFEKDLDALFHHVNRELVRRAAPKPGEDVLDIGCGTGATSREFARHVTPGGSITALDISAPLLNHAVTRFGRSLASSSHWCLDAQQDPIPGAPFNIATSRFGVMFFSNPVAAFANIRKHLRNEGRLVIAAWATINENPWLYLPKDAAVKRMGPADPLPPNAPGPLAFQDLSHVVKILKLAGFQNVLGEAVDITLQYSGELQKVAELASNIGPAARVLRKYGGDDEDTRAIQTKVLEEFRDFVTSEGVDIPARFNFFEATNAS